MGKKIFYGLGLMLAFILGYFVISFIDDGVGRTVEEDFDFSNNSLYSNVMSNYDILNEKIEVLNSTVSSTRYDEDTLNAFKEYFSGYADYVSEFEIIDQSGASKFSIEELETILIEIALPDFEAAGKIDIYATAINGNTNKDELVNIYSNKQASYLYLNDPGAVGIIDSENVRISDKDNLYPNMYMNYILAYLDLQLVEHIELLTIINN